MHQRLLDLDHLAAGVGQPAELPVHRRRHVPHEIALVRCVLVGAQLQHAGEQLGRDGAEFDRAVAARLRDPPELVELERRSELDPADDGRQPPGAEDLCEQRARRVDPLVARRQRLLGRDAREALDGICDPRSPAEIGVEVIVAVREDVEPRPLLIRDDGRHRIRELLPEARVGERLRRGTPPEAAGEPERPRPRAGHRRGQRNAVGGGEHR